MDNLWATEGRWLDNEKFIYKMGNYVYIKTVRSSAKPVSVLTVDKIYNPIPLDGEGKKFLYWTDNQPLPKVGDLNGYYHPVPLDNGSYVALKAEKANSQTEVILSYVSAGIRVIDEKSQALNLDEGNINIFAVSPK